MTGLVAAAEIDIAAPASAVWEALTDIDAMPSWRIGLKSVTRLPDKNGLPVHTENTTAGKMTFETTLMDPPRRLVRGMASDLPFGGTWTFDVAPAPDGSGRAPDRAPARRKRAR